MMRRFLILVMAASILAGALFLGPAPALAQGAGSFKEGFDAVETFREKAGVKRFESLGDIVLAILGVVGALAAVIALAALVYGAVVFITSLGDESKASQAKKIILYAIVGLIVLGAAGIVVNVAINLIKK